MSGTLKNFLGAAVVIAIALVFVVQFRPASNTQVSGPGITCAIEVRGACVESTEFWASYRLLAPPNADAARLRAMGLRRITAEGLFERWLLNEDAKRLGINVSGEDVTAELGAGRAHLSLPADKMRQVGNALGLTEDTVRYLFVRNRQTKKFDNKQYEKEVRLRTKLSPADFRAYQEKELVAARMRDLIRARVHVSENEAFEQFSREKSTRTADYIRFDKRFFADVVVDNTDKAVAAWADANKELVDKSWENRKDQYLPECRVTRHILAKFKEAPEDPEHDRAAAKARIEKAIERVNGGETFADVARSVSDDTSADRGGELGCVAKGRMVKPFEDEVFELKAGEMSGPVETEYGFHVIQVDKILKDADAEKHGRLQIAREMYLAQESDRLAAEGAKQVLAATTGGKPLAEALAAYLDQVVPAGKKGGDDKTDAKNKKQAGGDKPAVTAANHPQRPAVETTTPFTISSAPISDAKAGADVARVAFELGKPGDLAKDVVPLEQGYAVLQLKEATAASQEQWAKDREYYVSAMRAFKQNDALISYVRRLKSTIGSEMKYDEALIKEPVNKEGAPPEGAEGTGDEGE